MKKGKRLLIFTLGFLGLMTIALLGLISVFQVQDLTVIRQETEILYQPDTSEIMSFEFSYLSVLDNPEEIEKISFVAKDFPVYIVDRSRRTFGPFQVTTVKAVIAPKEMEWPETGGLDLSETILTLSGGNTVQVNLGTLRLVQKIKHEGPFQITEMSSNPDGSFVIRIDAQKMLHFASIANTMNDDVLAVLDITINDKPVADWKGLLVPQGEIVIHGEFKEKAVPELQTMRLSPTITLEDEKGNPFQVQFTTERTRQTPFTVFNLLSYTRQKGGSE